jgi:hypothetical protein
LKAARKASFLLQGKSFELSSAVIRIPATKEQYERKLLGFLKRTNMSTHLLVQFTKDNPSVVEMRWLNQVN